MRSRLLLFLGFASGLFIMIIVGSIFLTPPYQYKGSWINPASAAADFVLTDQNGKPFQLSQVRNQVVVLFFGYTHCGDVCPLTLAQFRQVKSRLKEDAGTRFIFVSVDPERDTPDALKQYLSAFDPSFIGLTGSRSELEKVWADYGITVLKTNVKNAEDYDVEHTARIYVIDQKGYLQLTYPSGFDTNSIVEDLNHLKRVVR